MDQASPSNPASVRLAVPLAACRVSVDEAASLLQEWRRQGRAVRLFDIRDAAAFADSHYPDAVRLGPADLDAQLESTDRSTPVLIYCYHGQASQRVAQRFAENGFERACSIDGGWEFLRHRLPRVH